MNNKIEINHKEYMAKVKNMSEQALRYTIKDARAAHDAMPDGAKAGYYLDEISYCMMELRKRAGND